MYLLSSLFILFLTLSACSAARPLVAVDEASSIQINNCVKVSEHAKKQLSKSNSATTEDIKGKKDIGAEREVRSKHMTKVHLNKALETTIDFVPMKSAESVSWSVPHSKQDHDDPEIYSDYSRPTTRPPSHN